MLGQASASADVAVKPSIVVGAGRNLLDADRAHDALRARRAPSLLIPTGGAAGGRGAPRPAGAAAASRRRRHRPPPTVTDNPFSRRTRPRPTASARCPQPGCGSKAHGGWRQALMFVVVALALAFIGWRIVASCAATAGAPE